MICYLIALYLHKNKHREISLYVNLSAAVLTLFIISISYFGPDASITSRTKWLLLIADGILVLVSVIAFCRFRNLAFLIVPPLVCLMLFHGIYSATSDELVSTSEYTRVTDRRIGPVVHKLLQKDSFYRIEQMGEKQENAANLNRIWSSGQ